MTSCNIIRYFFSKVILCQWEIFFKKLEIGFGAKHINIITMTVQINFTGKLFCNLATVYGLWK